MSSRMSGPILITGAGGLLGTELARYFSERGDVIGLSRGELDVSDVAQVTHALERLRPRTVLHAAAYTSVDQAEGAPAVATMANVVGAMIVARACQAINATMVHYSTDYVFDGAADRPYTEDDPVNPRTVYGKTKRKGEAAVAEILPDALIFRVAWLYGHGGRSFVRTIVRKGRDWLAGDRSAPLAVVDDQTGDPTWTREVARQTEVALDGGLSGVCHASSMGATTPYHLAQRVFQVLNMPVSVRPCASADVPRPAVRPIRSALTNARLEAAGLNVMRDWRVALDEFLGLEGGKDNYGL